MSNEILNSREAAKYLRLNDQTVRSMAREGKIPAFKVGNSWRFDIFELDNWAKSYKPILNSQKKILVIDDDEWVHNLISASLKNERYHIIYATDGKNGLNILKKEKIDFIFLDLVMPNMSGADVLKKIRKDYGDIPVTIITGHLESDMMDTVLNYSPVIVLSKPFNQQQLLDCLKVL